MFLCLATQNISCGDATRWQSQSEGLTKFKIQNGITSVPKTLP